MGRIAKPEDVLKGKRHMLKELARDLSPGQVERVESLLKRLDDESKDELMRLLGKRRAERLLKEIGTY